MNRREKREKERPNKKTKPFSQSFLFHMLGSSSRIRFLPQQQSEDERTRGETWGRRGGKIVFHTLTDEAFMQFTDCFIGFQMKDEKKIHIQHMCTPKATLDTYINIPVCQSSQERSGWPTVQHKFMPYKYFSSQSPSELSLRHVVRAYSYPHSEGTQTGFMITPFPSSGTGESGWSPANWFKTSKSS